MSFDLWDHGLYDVFTFENALGRQMSSIDEQLQYNRGCYFSHANYASLTLCLFSE